MGLTIETDYILVAGITGDGLRIRKRFSPSRYGKDFKKIAAAYYEKMLFEKAGLQVDGFGIKAKNFRQMTVLQLGERYIKEHLFFTKAYGNKSYIDAITKKWGQWRLSQITIEQVRPWIFELFGKYKPRSVKKIVRYFQRLFNWGCDAGLIDRKPLEHLLDMGLKKQFARTTKPVISVLTESQFKDLLKVSPVFLQWVCRASWLTGMRLGEVLGLRWNQIDGEYACLSAGETKEVDSKIVFLNKDFLVLLDEIRAARVVDGIESTNIFLGAGNQILNNWDISKSFHHYVKKLGLSVTFHDLRRSYINRMERAGISLRAIGAQVGHHAAETTVKNYRAVEQSEQSELRNYSR